jgi:DNA-binding winged helix-turn-helix (wHTH) protein
VERARVAPTSYGRTGPGEVGAFAKIFRIHMSAKEVFRFGDFSLDIAERQLKRGFETLRLAPKALDVLIVLVREHGRLVSKQELLARVWPNVFVHQGILTVHVAALRKVLGHAASAEWIQTVPREGYRFVGDVRRTLGPSRTAGGMQPNEVQALLRAGQAHLLTGSSSEMPAALAAFNAAVRIDAACAPAHAGLALTRCVQANLRAVPHVHAYTEAKVAALRALAMDSDSADAQAALGAVLFWSEWDWTAAEHSLARALAIEPDHCEALLHYGALHDALDNREMGLRFKLRALAQAPRSPHALMEVAVSCSL